MANPKLNKDSKTNQVTIMGNKIPAKAHTGGTSDKNQSDFQGDSSLFSTEPGGRLNILMKQLNMAKRWAGRAKCLPCQKIWMILSWNIRGLNNPLKQSEVKYLIVRNKVVILGILETRVKEQNMNIGRKNLKLPGWELIQNYSSDDSGRIWILFDPNKVNISVVKSGMEFIHCREEWGNKVFLWTYTYGSYEMAVRKALWQEIGWTSSDVELPWLIQGDFNAVLSNADRAGGNPVDLLAANDFQECLLKSNLLEIQTVGPRFTWTNNQEEDRRILRKID
ncbi:DNase I-like protein [Dioscorea alata]|uniref:DNase I-like protein n=1 Tax=Dioscorea alata TaxID=55571 RepID=A0ACB7UZ57_DIOAL|nr:DNase I-like protein [Dioscorea alata]